jgi:hypothetical protein
VNQDLDGLIPLLAAFPIIVLLAAKDWGPLAWSTGLDVVSPFPTTDQEFLSHVLVNKDSERPPCLPHIPVATMFPCGQDVSTTTTPPQCKWIGLLCSLCFCGLHQSIFMLLPKLDPCSDSVEMGQFKDLAAIPLVG